MQRRKFSLQQLQNERVGLGNVGGVFGEEGEREWAIEEVGEGCKG